MAVGGWLSDTMGGGTMITTILSVSTPTYDLNVICILVDPCNTVAIQSIAMVQMQ